MKENLYENKDDGELVIMMMCFIMFIAKVLSKGKGTGNKLFLQAESSDMGTSRGRNDLDQSPPNTKRQKVRDCYFLFWIYVHACKVQTHRKNTQETLEREREPN